MVIFCHFFVIFFNLFFWVGGPQNKKSDGGKLFLGGRKLDETKNKGLRKAHRRQERGRDDIYVISYLFPDSYFLLFTIKNNNGGC